MNVVVEWFDAEKQILLQSYRGDWGSADIHYAVETSFEMAETVDHDIFIITVFEKKSRSPKYLLDMANYLRDKSIPNVRLAFLVRPDVYLTSVIGLAHFLIPHYVSGLRVTHSLDDALTQIRGMSRR